MRVRTRVYAFTHTPVKITGSLELWWTVTSRATREGHGCRSHGHVGRQIGRWPGGGRSVRPLRPPLVHTHTARGWIVAAAARPRGRSPHPATWPHVGRRSPAPVADACLGALTANMARRAGQPSQLADSYTERHFDRALAPMIVSSSGICKLLRPRQIPATMLHSPEHLQVREVGAGCLRTRCARDTHPDGSGDAPVSRSARPSGRSAGPIRGLQIRKIPADVR